MKPKPKFQLSPNQRLRIRTRSGLANETLNAIRDGKPVKEASQLRFERAVAEEGIELSPPSDPPLKAAS